MKILLAVDSSEYSKTAAENVSKRPWPPETVVRVLSAVQDFVPPASELWYDAGGSLEEANLHVIKQAEQLTDKIGEAVRASGLTVETTVRRGDPRSVILDEAKVGMRISSSSVHMDTRASSDCGDHLSVAVW
jgi:hypothetical protein